MATMQENNIASEPPSAEPVEILWPLPPGKKGRRVHRELAWTYRQFGQIIGSRNVREVVIADSVRPERVIAAYAGPQLLGYLAIRLDGTGPFTLEARHFRRQFGRVQGTLRYAGYRLLERRERRDEIFIDGFLVSPEARGGGIGRRLLEMGETIGRQAGKRVFRVRVRSDNEKAAAFYQRQGFRKEGLSEISVLGKLVGIGPVYSYAKTL